MTSPRNTASSSGTKQEIQSSSDQIQIVSRPQIYNRFETRAKWLQREQRLLHLTHENTA